jgi:hypothetical protein
MLSGFHRCLLILCLSLTSSDLALAIEAKAVNPGEPTLPFAVQFPMVFKTQIDSSHISVGDRVEGTLKENLTVEGKLVAPAGSSIIGHIQTLIQSRRLATSAFSKQRRFKKGSSLKICFDEIIAAGNKHIAIVGRLSKQKFTVKHTMRPREIEVGAQGEFTKAEEVFTTQQQAAAAAVNFITGTGIGQLGTVASFGALPVVMGVVGAVNPDLVTMRPMKADEKHPKVKGFAYGVLTSVPGAPVIQAFAFKGQEIHIEPGDEFMVQAHAAEPESVANLAVSATRLPKSDAPAPKVETKVEGTIVPSASKAPKTP